MVTLITPEVYDSCKKVIYKIIICAIIFDEVHLFYQSPIFMGFFFYLIRCFCLDIIRLSQHWTRHKIQTTDFIALENLQEHSHKILFEHFGIHDSIETFTKCKMHFTKQFSVNRVKFIVKKTKDQIWMHTLSIKAFNTVTLCGQFN